MDKTAQALRDAGIAVRTIISDDLCAGSAEVVHGFGLTDRHIAMAKKRGLPVVLSTIYLPRRYYRHVMRAISGRLYAQALMRHAVSTIGGTCRLRRPWYADAKRALDLADLLLPNSAGEAEALRRELHVRAPIRVIPNGVDEGVFCLPEYRAVREYVAYVGRLEPHKNQLGLIQALRGSGFPLLLVGPIHPHHAAYAQRCRAAARGQPVDFRSELSHLQLAVVYQHARVHAMPSFFETTGLASLEAALCGCAVVSTKDGWAGEYFGDCATYCRPTSHRSIRLAIERAWSDGARPSLRHRILERYTWRHTARETVAAYEWLLTHGAAR